MIRSDALMPPAWTAGRLSAATALAVALPLGAALIERGAAFLAPLALALGLAVAWRLVFAWARGMARERAQERSVGWDGLAQAGIVVLMLPADTPLWSLALALSFGLVLGDLIFGARGRGFLCPATVALAFLLFAAPSVQGAAPGPMTAGATLAGVLVLLVVRLVSWRVLTGFGVALAALGLAGGWPDVLNALPGAVLALVGLVFLIGDPVAGACTNPGRWAYGALAGALSWLLARQGGGVLPAIVYAAFLASLLAPLIDQAAIAAMIRRRRLRPRDG